MFVSPLASHNVMPEWSCVYSIRHEVSGREYIGRTNNLRSRMRKHWQELASGSHKNPKMLRTYRKYGGDFIVRPLVIGTPEYCEIIEAGLLAGIENLKDSLNCHRNSTGGWLGQDWSDESRKKLSDARKGKAMSKEAQARALETRKTSPAWKAHLERLSDPETYLKGITAAAKPEVRAKAVATRSANGHKPFSDEVRQRQRDEAKARLFAALTWAVETNATREEALKKYNCSWGSLKKYQPEWEEFNGQLQLAKRAIGEKSGMFKHGLSKEIKRKRTPEERAERYKKQSERMAGANNPMYGRKHTDAARQVQSLAAKKQAEDRRNQTSFA